MTVPKELTTVTLVSRTVEVIVLVAAMIIGFGLGINYQETIDLLKQQNSAIHTTTTQTASTANWKTYTDPTGTFTIKYPSGLYETKENPGAPVIKGWSFAGHLSTSKNGYAAIDRNGMYFDFYVITRKTREDMKSFVNRVVSERAGEFQPGDVSSDFKKYINLGDKNSLWYEGSLGPAVIHTEIFIPYDDKRVVAIGIWTNEPFKTRQPYSINQKILIDQILSTFQFTE